jgi:cytochrome c-type biogenesis protein CcmH/NrfG
MKFKISYIYILFVIAAVIVLIIVSNIGNTQSTSNNPTDQITGKQMPEDEIHKGIQSPASPPPSSQNVSESFKQELNSLKKAVDDDPGDTVALKKYADLLVASHKPQESIKLYESILKRNPKRIDILFSLSFVYFNSSDFRKAEEITNKILHFDKKNIQAQYNLGAIAASNGNTEEARRIWNKLLNENPNSDLSSMISESLKKLK